MVQLAKVFGCFLFDVVELAVDFALAVVFLFAVGGPEFTSVDGEGFSGDQSDVFKEECVEFKAVFERDGVELAKVGDGVVVGGEGSEKPAEFDVSQTFFFQSSAAADAVELAIAVEFEQAFEFEGRSAIRWNGRFWLLAFLVFGRFVDKTEQVQIKLFDEGIDDADRVLFMDLFIQR